MKYREQVVDEQMSVTSGLLWVYILSSLKENNIFYCQTRNKQKS